MKYYKYKCKSCGSNKYEKIDENTYRCIYCGCEEKIIFDNKDKDFDEETKTTNNGTNVNITGNADKKEDSFKNNINDNFIYSLVKLLIVIFVGGLGIHKFLEKKYFVGIIYLFTCGLFGIGWVIDIITYALRFLNELGEISK